MHIRNFYHFTPTPHMSCGQSPDWFIKAYNGDTAYIEKNIKKKKCQ